ncbi:hypothetical protein ACVRZR_07575 [Streptococcus entericus]|uniref:hypothetical protein n=1 Tax=Streptococcus entericus TaxID=155680 RepID=UPI000376014C|nr:hypothetical protein [Streptococcus entericus]
MPKTLDKDRFFQLVTTAYNHLNHQITDDLKQGLLETAKTIQNDGNLDLAAVRLARLVTAEIRYYQLGKTAPKELVDLANFVNKKQGHYWFWSSLTRLSEFKW